MKTKIWNFLRGSNGAPIENAKVDVYVYPVLGGLPGYAYIYPTVPGSETTTEIYSLLTDANGYFEFYIADKEESDDYGYEFDREFKIKWSKVGISDGYVDKIQLFDVTNRPADITQTTSIRNKMVSNLQAKTWQEHITDTVFDTHAQYLRADGTRPLTANWDVAAGNYIITDVVSGRTDLGTLTLKPLPSSTAGIGITILSTGSVGIGTVAPTTALDVVGAGKFSLGVRVSGMEGSSSLGTSSDNLYIQTPTPNKYIYFRPDGPGSDTGRIIMSKDGINVTGTGTSYIGGSTKIGGTIGFWDTVPSDSYGIYALKSSSDPATGTMGMYLRLYPTYTTTLSRSYDGIVSRVYPTINYTISNTSYVSAINGTVLRNYTNDGDRGTLTSLYGMSLSYGHSNAYAVTPITTTAYGLHISPYYKTGTITTMYDIYLAADETGGTATNRWGIYQESANKNYFSGNVGIGDTNPGSKLSVAGLSTYADNAAAKAGGLTDNDFYRTSTGVLMVVYT